jgi:hypothetical protein
MTSTITIVRTTLEGVERVMRRRQWIALIGFALIGSECRAVAIRPHDAVAVSSFGNRERAALRHDEARSSVTAFRHAALRDRGIFIPHSRSPRMVNVELKRYSRISVHGGSTTIVTQAGRTRLRPRQGSPWPEARGVVPLHAGQCLDTQNDTRRISHAD